MDKENAVHIYDGILCVYSVMSDSANPWTVTCQDHLEFSRQEYWSELPFPSPGDLTDAGIKPTFLACPALAHTMDYHSSIKKNEIMPFAATWMDLEVVILSEVSQRRNIVCIPYLWNLKRNDTNEITCKTETHRNKLMVARGKDAGTG